MRSNRKYYHANKQITAQTGITVTAAKAPATRTRVRTKFTPTYPVKESKQPNPYIETGNFGFIVITKIYAKKLLTPVNRIRFLATLNITKTIS